MHERLLAEFDLSGRVAVITGAASGIGRVVASTLAEAGAIPVLADRDEGGMAGTAASVAEIGLAASCHQLDVTDRCAVDVLADRVFTEHGRLDAWVNCAGAIFSRPVIEAREDEVERLLDVNLKGTYWGCAAAGRIMQAQGRGAIVNFSSAGAEIPAPGLSVYSMTKAGVVALTRTLAHELAPFGVRANAVAPGWVETPLALHSVTAQDGAVDQAAREKLVSQRAAGTPLGTIGTARDMALAALYLVADASRFMTGQVLRPNGGIVMV